MSNKKSTHLYILSCDDKIKIGITSDIDKRIAALQTGNPSKIVLEHIEERLKPQGAEKYLHRCFGANRLEGEWFKNITVDMIRSRLMLYFDQD